MIKAVVLSMGVASCATTPEYPYSHYFYDRPDDLLIARDAALDKPASVCDPSAEHYYTCIVYRESEHRRLKADHLKLLVELKELERKVKMCK